MRVRGWLPLVAVLCLSAPSRADDLLYYVRGDEIVFTNVPDRSDAKPLPGFRAVRGYRSADLPRTVYDPFIDRVALENGVDPALIKAVALVESGFDPRAVSRAGARGIMQFMPATARRYGLRDLHDPYQSLRAGAQHLRDLLDEFGGDVSLALAAYNAGPDAVRRYGGVPRYAETQEYVRKVEARLGRAPRPAAPAGPVRSNPPVLHVAADGSVTITN